ncbi:uncharacterized protein AMSG_01999 [Thecamonas trahens ATCC 50062]|uniref:Uncharacterized protein n=1 Tax=Thecamonas trahens ATCC 50062 TaxID=461836 RepID=A0A0L0DV65_THETB|nr:hypothetical protein AMSG_01999 [Thecamonas trahens ATCC 50062]KNC55986.1 hypothetical protein AMSG_01999 [Thecamonas trahens ATCC 50062]|eukprot:XP_013761032.1 hypothetical protein AMSG_01999 [Thecamonas trahens ATCC 50062]
MSAHDLAAAVEADEPGRIMAVLEAIVGKSGELPSAADLALPADRLLALESAVVEAQTAALMGSAARGGERASGGASAVAPLAEIWRAADAPSAAPWFPTHTAPSANAEITRHVRGVAGVLVPNADDGPGDLAAALHAAVGAVEMRMAAKAGWEAQTAIDCTGMQPRQLDLLAQINDSFAAQMAMRRKLLLERLGVTLDALARSKVFADGTPSSEASAALASLGGAAFAAAVHPLFDPQVPLVRLPELAAASLSIAELAGFRIPVRPRAAAPQAKVKTLVLAMNPRDRGGRPANMGKSSLPMPAFASRGKTGRNGSTS